LDGYSFAGIRSCRMTLYCHHVVGFGPGRREAVLTHIESVGVPAIVGQGGRLFGLFKPLLGLSLNHAIVIVEWPDDARATTSGGHVLAGLEGATLVQHDLWEATLRPDAGALLPHVHGLYSHRWFDVRVCDLPRFLELSGTSWDNFETAHGSQVIGLWRSRTQPAPGVARMRLTAWYQDMAAWERSRWFNKTAGAEIANANFAERAALTLDSAVSIVQRVA
jgi:hypothetical protein